jgi:HSP20 family protein
MIKTQFSPNAFNGFIEDIFNGNPQRFFRDQPAHEHGNHIPVNIKETDASFNIDIVAPGVSKEDFSIQVNDKTLTIAFELKENDQKDDSKWIRKEFKVRSFKRSFTLGDKVDADKIAASYNQGILTLALPKKEAAIATNRSINIQ